jgi:hypothetical protein
VQQHSSSHLLNDTQPLTVNVILKLQEYVLPYRDINFHCFIPIILNKKSNYTFYLLHYIYAMCGNNKPYNILKDLLHLLSVDSHVTATK